MTRVEKWLKDMLILFLETHQLVKISKLNILRYYLFNNNWLQKKKTNRVGVQDWAGDATVVILQSVTEEEPVDK